MLKSKKWALALRLIFGVLLALVVLVKPKPAFAALCNSYGLNYTKNFNDAISCSNIPPSARVSVEAKGDSKFILGVPYTLEIINQFGVRKTLSTKTPTNNLLIEFNDINPSTAFESGEWKLLLKGNQLGVLNECGITDKSHDYTVSTREWFAGVYLTQNRGGKMCYGHPSGCLEANVPTTLTVENIKLCGKPYANKEVEIASTILGNIRKTTDSQGNITGAPITFTAVSSGQFDVILAPFEYRYTDKIASLKPLFNEPGTCDTCLTTKPKPIDPNQPYEYKICDQINGNLKTPEGASAKDACLQCVGGNELGREGIWTAIGCIPRDPEKIVKSLLRLGLGMGGGFALIIILASGFVLSVSQGEPNRINEAKQWLTSALVGMLFIIFSVTLLHFIGYTIFRIPGFGGP